MKKIVLASFVALIAVLSPDAVVAQCDCFLNVSKDVRGSHYSTAYEELKNSDVVFWGQVVEMKMIDRKPIREGADPYEIEIKFRVEKAWRKEVDEFVTIREYADGCGIGFGIADRWLVYADLDKNRVLRAGYCTRTRVAYNNVETDFKEFEKNGEKQTRIIKGFPKR